jgi:hypothetical protein
MQTVENLKNVLVLCGTVRRVVMKTLKKFGIILILLTVLLLVSYSHCHAQVAEVEIRSTTGNVDFGYVLIGSTEKSATQSFTIEVEKIATVAFTMQIHIQVTDLTNTSPGSTDFIEAKQLSYSSGTNGGTFTVISGNLMHPSDSAVTGSFAGTLSNQVKILEVPTRANRTGVFTYQPFPSNFKLTLPAGSLDEGTYEGTLTVTVSW